MSNELPGTADRFDFSQFHPLDHVLGSSRCTAFYPYGFKSLPHHAKLSWKLTYKGQLSALTFCKLGLHKFTFWGLADDSYVACDNCHKRPVRDEQSQRH